MKIAVVGASSGLGRCIGIDRSQRGDQVAFLARRADRIRAAAQEAGPLAIAITCDVTDEDSCRTAIAEATESLSGLDVLVYTAGIGSVQPVEMVSGQTWRQCLETNVVGAALVTAAALPALADSHGLAIYLSSISASIGRPWPGLGAYTVSKAALDRLIEVYRVEHPSVRFSRVVVGDCAGEIGGPGQVGFADNWDAGFAAQFQPIWAERGYSTGKLMPIQDFLQGIDFLVNSGAQSPTMWLTP
jgi:NAD(P)-dependent dehydrogenase (short-subunit alcohol dehydrogenase family)